jgi:hypothetical protein
MRHESVLVVARFVLSVITFQAPGSLREIGGHEATTNCSRNLYIRSSGELLILSQGEVMN